MFWRIIAYLFTAVIGFFGGFFYALGRLTNKKTSKRIPVVFEYEDSNAKEVSVVGDFNDWDPKKGKMVNLGSGLWSTTFYLYPGRYEYLFNVDGKYVLDPKAKHVVDDGNEESKRAVLILEDE